MKKLMQKLLMTLMLISVFASTYVVLANEPGEGCGGLGCTQQSDCGNQNPPKCFCNRPSETCFTDEIE
jgi:hypothetical protein